MPTDQGSTERERRREWLRSKVREELNLVAGMGTEVSDARVRRVAYELETKVAALTPDAAPEVVERCSCGHTLGEHGTGGFCFADECGCRAFSQPTACDAATAAPDVLDEVWTAAARQAQRDEWTREHLARLLFFQCRHRTDDHSPDIWTRIWEGADEDGVRSFWRHEAEWALSQYPATPTNPPSAEPSQHADIGLWVGYRCNDCGEPWTDDHVHHGERQKVLLAVAPTSPREPDDE